MQPLDQHVGHFIQVRVHNKYRELLIQQEKELQATGEIKKIGLPTLRRKITKWIADIWNELKTNQH